jgi:TonB-linked SusC/RagA family outer membrane protein
VRARLVIATIMSLALVFAGRASAQGTMRRITGRILDSADHQPLPGAQVLLTGTTIGVVTTDSGTFVLRVPSGAQSLSVRRIGYRSSTRKLTDDQTEVTVDLLRDVLQLDQQVITGVGTAISSKNSATHDPVIVAAAISNVPTPTIENALQGKVPGALISDNSGAPGGGLQVQVRGTTSIYATAAGQPLYVIDGVIMSNASIPSGLNSVSGAAGNTSGNGPSPQDQQTNRIADINPADIESLQFLEGSAASAIYGSKGAAGVILITTKHGAAGKPVYSFTQRVGSYDLSNTLPVRRFTLPEAQTNNISRGGPLTAAEVTQNYNQCHGFCDFQNQLYGNTGPSYETDLSVSGATPSTDYFVSGLTKYDNGAETNTGYQKQSIRTNILQHVASTLTASANVAYAASTARRGVNGNDNLGIAGYDNISYTPSYFNMDARNSNGSYVRNPYGVANAFDDAARILTPENVNRITAGGNLDFKPVTTRSQSLEFILQAGADYAIQKDQFYAPADLQVETSPLSAFPGTSTYQSATNQLSNYSFSIIHTYTGIRGVQATTSAGLTHDQNALYLPDIVSQDLVAGLANQQYGVVQTSFYSQQNVVNQGFYGQEQVLLFDERLAVTGGLNAEASSNDGGVNRYYPYPKASVSYRFPNPIRGIDEIKLRGAYGVSGTVPNYGVKFNADSLCGYLGSLGTKFGLVAGDPGIQPETNTDFETGFDLTLLKGKLTFNATGYRKRITNLLLQAQALPSTGFDQQWINGGEITNQGLELQIAATPITTGHFTWITGENFARNQAVVNNIPVPAFTPGFTSFGFSPFGGYRIQAGASPSAFWGQTLVNGVPTLTALGDANPAFTMGFTNDFSYDRLHLHTFFDMRRGFKVSDLTEQYFDGSHNLEDTAGTTARTAAESQGLTPYLYNGDYLKLRELTLRYDLPFTFIDRVGRGMFRTASLSVSGRNLIVWTKYPGLDPDVSNFSNQLVGRGQDVPPYPPTRSFFFSIDLGL